MSNHGPGYTQHPEHRVELSPAGQRVTVVVNGEIIADSDDALVLHEGTYPPVYYLPRQHVKMERLSRTDHHTHCPFKGEASYFSIVKPGGVIENAVWSYEQPYDEVAPIRDRLAFYPNKVDSIRAS